MLFRRKTPFERNTSDRQVKLATAKDADILSTDFCCKLSRVSASLRVAVFCCFLDGRFFDSGANLTPVFAGRKSPTKRGIKTGAMYSAPEFDPKTEQRVETKLYSWIRTSEKGMLPLAGFVHCLKSLDRAAIRLRASGTNRRMSSRQTLI